MLRYSRVEGETQAVGPYELPPEAFKGFSGQGLERGCGVAMVASALGVSPVELTTGATDAVLALECAGVVLSLRRGAGIDHWRRTLWCWLLGLSAVAAALGAAAHGVQLPDPLPSAVWWPISLCLGIAAGLFVVGAVYDLRGRGAAGPLIPWSVAGGVVVMVLTQISGGSFSVFLVYYAAAMATSFGVYSFLAGRRRLPGSGLVAAAILLNLAAAAVQASSLSFHLLFPFDHNGLFHLIQMVSVAVLGLGLRFGMQREGHAGTVAAPVAAGRYVSGPQR